MNPYCEGRRAFIKHIFQIKDNSTGTVKNITKEILVFLRNEEEISLIMHTTEQNLLRELQAIYPNSEIFLCSSSYNLSEIIEGYNGNNIVINL